MDNRRYDLDHSRIMATLAIFVFHNVRLFDEMDWHVKNAEQSLAATLFIGSLDAWLMPLFFVLSGAGSWYALSRRSMVGYAVERFKRLVIPFWIAGGLLLLPPQFWLDSLTHGRFDGGVLESYPLFFQTVHVDVWPPFLLFWTGHLWFLVYLFTISLTTLPLLFVWRKGRAAPMRDRISSLLGTRFGPLLPFVPLFLIQLALRGVFPDQFGFASLAYFAAFFLWGYLLPGAGEACMARCRALAVPCLVLAAALFGAEGYLILGLGYSYPGGQSFIPFLPYLVFQAVMSLQAVCWITGALGLAQRFLSQATPWTRPGNEAVLPFYLLHQTVILLVGAWVVTLPMGIPVKLAMNLALSFAGIAAIYALLIRPVPFMRFIFGMRPKR